MGAPGTTRANRAAPRCRAAFTLLRPSIARGHGILGGPTRTAARSAVDRRGPAATLDVARAPGALGGGSATVTLPPWEYLFVEFNAETFPDLFNPIWVAALIGLAATILLYAVRTRQLRRHQIYLDMYEWLLWAGVIFFSLILIGAVFSFDFIFILLFIPAGVGVMLWIRFVRFPPFLAAYEAQLARARYISKRTFAHPEATIRPRRAARSTRRRR
jgi:hypothetical protein